jgi:hypothetical protein
MRTKAPGTGYEPSARSIDYESDNGRTYTVPTYDESPSMPDAMRDFADTCPETGGIVVDGPQEVTGRLVTANDLGRVIDAGGAVQLSIPTDEDWPVGSVFAVAAADGKDVGLDGNIQPKKNLLVYAKTAVSLVKVQPDLWLIANAEYTQGDLEPPPENPRIAFESVSTTHHSITITNYNPDFDYEITGTTGTVDVSALPLIRNDHSAGAAGTIYVKAYDGASDPAGPSSLVFTPYTYNRSEGEVIRWYEHAGGSEGPGPACGDSWSCTYYPNTNTSGHNVLYITCGLKDYTPANYNDNGVDWHREINP